MLERIYIRHGPTLVTMARAIFETKRKYGVDFPSDVEETLYPFLDRFYTSRIGIRTLIGMCGAARVRVRVLLACARVLGCRALPAAQHLELRHLKQGFVGIIDIHTNPAAIAETAVCVPPPPLASLAVPLDCQSLCVCVCRSADARYMCERTFGEAPKVCPCLV